MSDTFPCPDHEAKIAVLEVEVANIKKTAADTQQWLQSIDSKVDSIKERIDKQNGAIPHMSADIVKLTELVSVLHATTVEIKLTATNTESKTRIVWGILVAVGAAALGVIVKTLTG